MRILFLFSIRLYPAKKKKEKQQEERKEKSSFDTQTIIRQIEQLTEVLKKATHGAKVTKYKIYANISGDDPADTALLYGGLNAAVYALAAFLYANVNSKEPDIRISCDYLGNPSAFNADVELRFHLISLLRGLLFWGMHGILPTKQTITE